MDRNRCPICGQTYESEQSKKRKFIQEKQCLEQEPFVEEYANYFALIMALVLLCIETF